MAYRIRYTRDTSRRESKGAITLQKKLAESTRRKAEPAPDLTDFMNDMFFGAATADKKAYNLTGEGGMDEDEDFESSTRSNSSRMTQEWLEEARRMVASSPTRCDSPSSKLVGSPRFAAAQGSPALLDRRDPLSRSARRNRAVESFSGEILSKSAKHNRKNSEFTATTTTPPDLSPASAVHKWFSNILKPVNPPHSTPDPTPDPTALTLPPSRQPINRKSRFQTDLSSHQPPGIPIPSSRRTFKNSTQSPDTHLLSPPKSLTESTCSLAENPVLSPPRKLVESAHRRSISASTCSMDKIAPKHNASHGGLKEEKGASDHNIRNGFLKEQRIKLEKVLNGEIEAKAKIVLSGPSNSTSSMVAAICYTWLLENRMSKNKGEDDGEEFVVVPVMNLSRRRMWKHKQAAWLFHHVGVDATSLVFSDEFADSLLQIGVRWTWRLMMADKLRILVVGQDVLRTNGEVGYQCTILTDNYCEDAYDLLQTPALKKLLLAGILLDTQNLNASDKSSMTRDSEAVQLLLVGSAPNYRYALFDQLMQDQRDESFLEALRHNYGKPPTESDFDSVTHVELKVIERKSTSISQHKDIIHNPDKNPSNVRSSKTNRVSPKSAKPNPSSVQSAQAAPAQTASEAARAKPKFFLAKWFGFGSKNENK